MTSFQNGRRFKFLLSSASLAPWSMIPGTESWVINLAKKAGFDGVEFFLFGKWNHDRVCKVKELANKRGLVVHFHQVWSVSESSDEAAVHRSRIMHKLGLLPDEGYNYRDAVPTTADPVVAYADRIDELEGGDRLHAMFQTLSTFKPDGTKKITWEQFKQRVIKKDTLLVLDTMHFLEFSLNKRGVNDLPRHSDFIITELKKYWQMFGSRTKEIHFNDYKPGIGDAGRNVFPGQGIVPLLSFASHVKFTGWSGYITPEISPRNPFPHIPHSLSTLKSLRGYMRVCWGE